MAITREQRAKIIFLHGRPAAVAQQAGCSCEIARIPGRPQCTTPDEDAKISAQARGACEHCAQPHAVCERQDWSAARCGSAIKR